jgi:hypothetical protein
MHVIDNKIDFFFIKFPIIFPILYCACLYLFPNYEYLILLFTILILAEPHFGATWPFLTSERNHEMIINKKIEFIILPILILFFSVVFFFLFKKEFLLFFFVANMYHVTRQSTGVSKLYIRDVKEKKLHVSLIYTYNIILFLVGLLRFYLPIISNDKLLILNLILITIFIIIIMFCYLRFKKIDNLFTLSTGLLIFFPIAFVNNPVHAIIMGVTMHYSQYLILTSAVGLRRIQEKNVIKKGSLLKDYLVKFIGIIFIYSIIMTLFSYFGKSDSYFLKELILIPIVFQLLHFYFDGLLWKFSLKENRNNTLKYLLIKS